MCIGTWCTPEIKVALGKGYQIKKIFEVWHFPEQTNQLFKKYVRKCLKIKMESSPLVVGENCRKKSEEEFKNVVKEKLEIELGKIEHNLGMRAIAKMCSNSLWGKFGQRNNMKQTKFVTEPKEFYGTLLNDAIDNLNLLFLNEDMVQTNYDFVDNSKDTNIFIAAFTSSHARLMLYDVLDKLGDRVLGYDTDSAWYVERSGDEPVKTGDSLGDLTDELDGNFITAWCGTGPKSYSYSTSNGKNVCKVKGFTLNYKNSKHINQESLKELIEGKKTRITTVKKNAITRDSKTKQLVNKYQEKDLILDYDKRWVAAAGGETFHLGY